MKAHLGTLLQSNLLYIVLGLIACLYLLISFTTTRTSIYDEEDTIFRGHIANRVVSENKIALTLDAEEDLICNFYSDDEVELATLWDETPLGAEVTIEGKLNTPSNNTIPNTFNYKDYLYDKGIFYTCTITEIKVEHLSKNPFYIIKNAVVGRIMTYGIKDYLYTMIIGDKSLLDDETMAQYRANGVTHLFAISGMHVGLFAAIIGAILKKCKMKEQTANMIVVLFIWFYAFLAGFGASIIRAALLFTYIALDKLLDLKVSKLKILFLVFFTVVFTDYRIICDIGFIYSFVTTFGLVYASKTIEKHKILGTSLVASLASLPITIENFYKFNLASIIFNVVFVPLVSAVIYPLCLLTFFLRWLEPVTTLAIRGLELLNSLCASFDAFVFTIPALGLGLIIIYYAIFLLGMRKNLYKVSFLLLALVFLNKTRPYLDTNAHVEFLDVGQGDSTLIRDAHNREVILIDTGGQVGKTSSDYYVSDNTITYLNSLGIDKIDYLILTHGDADHLGDAIHLMSKIKVENVILNEGEYNAKEKEILKSGVNAIDHYDGRLRLTSLNDHDWQDENANSIVLHLKLEGREFLFMGDAPKEVENYITKKYKLRADFVKLGHHGSSTSSGEDFLKSVKPEVAIISSGRKNRYNHPSPETIDTLHKLLIDYYDTQDSGTITLSLKQGRVTTSTYPP